MGIEVAVVDAQLAQVIAQQREVQRLLLRHLPPVAVEGVGQAGEAPDRIERQIDRIGFDVRDGMQQCSAALAGEG